MNTLTLITWLYNAVVCAIVAWYAFCGLNACTPKTPLAVRISFYLLVVGAFALALYPPVLDVDGIGHILAMTGIAGGFLANRRKCACLNCPTREKLIRKDEFTAPPTDGAHPA